MALGVLHRRRNQGRETGPPCYPVQDASDFFEASVFLWLARNARAHLASPQLLAKPFHGFAFSCRLQDAEKAGESDTVGTWTVTESVELL